MHKLGYQWLRSHHGQYTVFIPQWKVWLNDGITEEIVAVQGNSQPVLAWHHDKSMFYANDHCHSGWVHTDAGADPHPKGEGESIMVSNFVSCEYGWCRSPDGKESARACDGYYSCDDILKQTSRTIDLLQQYYPDCDHIFIFDNAPTHLKHAEDALSACHMPKSTQGWKVDMTMRDGDGKILNGADGKPQKTKVHMANGHLADGTPQPLYFPKGHEHARNFKGMAQILQERGFANTDKLKAQQYMMYGRGYQSKIT
ncbi:hypothetical protein EDD15DRAFT_2383955 [Pisolithus albus]|nr:hypothetical protein EDD15DRAFT_2383955 [Pisolithus albus]